METFYVQRGFYFRGKVGELLTFLQQFDLSQSVADFTYRQLN
ncbi:MAG: hypothetical protein ACM3O9_00105 [Methylocystaceae bacterium]